MNKNLTHYFHPTSYQTIPNCIKNVYEAETVLLSSAEDSLNNNRNDDGLNDNHQGVERNKGLENVSESNEIDKKPVILIAEDEEFNFYYLEELLNEFRYKIIHAKDGKEALDLCIKNECIVLVLMDIKMPVMDGRTAARLIKEFRPDLPIVAQSAYALEYERKELLVFFNDILSKPIRENELKQKVSKFLSAI